MTAIFTLKTNPVTLTETQIIKKESYKIFGTVVRVHFGPLESVLGPRAFITGPLSVDRFTAGSLKVCGDKNRLKRIKL